MSFSTLSAILRGPWLIDRGYVNTHLPLIHGIITGKTNGAELFKGVAEMEKPFALSNGKRVPAYTVRFNEGTCQYEEIFNEDLFAENSVFVIPMIGPVMKYNGECGEPGMVKRSGWLADFANSSKLTGLITYIDSPGGQADGTPQYADAIKAIDKPKQAYVDGGAYSAGAWIASAHDNITISNKFTGFGSIGAYTTLVDYTDYFKQMGLKLIDIYPDESSEKNIEYRQAIAGNISLMKANVAELANFFKENFASNRDGRLKNDSWGKGKAFNGTDALAIGLVDAIGSFNDVAASMGAKITAPAKKIISLPSNSNNSNHLNMKFTNLTSLAGIDNPTDAQIDLANADLTSEAITHVTLVRDSFITDAANATTALTAANASVTSLTGELATANANVTKVTNELTAANTKITDLEAKVEAFGKNAGGAHLNAGGGDLPAEETDEDFETILANMPHNRAADALKN
jgi:protease-4